MIISLVFDGHVRNVDNLGLDVFVTFTIAAFTELPADTFLTLVLDRWGRRWLACGTMVFAGLFSVWASAVTDSKKTFNNQTKNRKLNFKSSPQDISLKDKSKFNKLFFH